MFIFDPGMTGIQGVLSILYLLTVVFVCLMIVFENRNPLKTLSWVLVILLIPFVGIIIYAFFWAELQENRKYSQEKA